jgi:primosomal protein N' (replication factor Y) (superfamily II helicase)
MIKSFMSYVDVVFPVSLGPLTYKCPAGLAGRAEPGMIVSAPLKNRITRGIIWGPGSVPPAGKVKDVTEIHGTSPVLGRGMMKLLRWMADYYLAHEGTVLKQTVPREIFAAARTARRSGKSGLPNSPDGLTAVPEEDISDIKMAIAEKQYRAFLVHAASSNYEYSLVRTLLDTGIRNVLVVFPEISRVSTLSGALGERFRDRVCVLHGDVAGGRRSEYIRGILAGTHDIIVGTGLALFAPMPHVSLIVVLQEHSSSYKREEGIRYNIRDAAVMRGYMEECTVALTSISPSIDSYFNSMAGKYSLIRPLGGTGRLRAKTVDMKFEKKASPGISRTALDISRSRLSQGKRIMFVINRRGHSTLFLCGECGHTEQCPSCNIPLVLHKKEKVLKCNYCGLVKDIPGSCERCGGHHLKLLGYGTQKVQEEIGRLLCTEAVRFDSDEVKKDSEIAEILRTIAGGSTKVIVGTRMMTKRLETEKFGLAVVLNADASLNIPDFRASEKTYMELLSIGELLEPGGQMIIQTRFPRNPVFRYLREGDYPSFVREELEVRKKLHYPPYSRLLQITFSGNADLARAEETVMKAGDNVEVLGPVIARSRKGEEQITFLLKSGDKRLLRAAAKKITGVSGTVKGLNVVVDVDPL